MGIDLALLPVTGEYTGHVFSHTRIDCPRYYEVFDLVRALETVSIGRDRFSAFAARVPDGSMRGESCYGVVEHDAYGQPITFVRAGALADAIESARNVRWQPILAFVRAMPPRDLVALYWH